MISNNELETLLLKQPGIDQVKVQGDGHHYHLEIVSDSFRGKNSLARQRWVYALLKDYITSGSLHALSMKTWTKEEWEQKNG